MAKQLITYVGKTSSNAGKTLWEIVGNLRDFGVGRIVVRNRHLRLHDTPCYYRILEVRTRVNIEPEKIARFRWPTDHRHLDVSNNCSGTDDAECCTTCVHTHTNVYDLLLQRPRLVHATCERVYKGVQYAEPVDLIPKSIYPDYALVPKHEEHKYRPLSTEQQVVDKNLYPTHVEYPPMLRRMLAASGEPDPKLEVVISENERDPILYRRAKDGEQATIDLPQGFGRVRNKRNLAGVDYEI